MPSYNVFSCYLYGRRLPNTFFLFHWETSFLKINPVLRLRRVWVFCGLNYAIICTLC